MLFIGIAKEKKWSLSILEGDELSLHYKTAVYGSQEDIVRALEKHLTNKPAWIFVDAPLVKGSASGRKHAVEMFSMLYEQFGVKFSYDVKRVAESSFLLDFAKSHAFEHDFPVNEFERSRRILSTNIDSASIALSGFHEPVSSFFVHEGSLIARYDALKDLAKALHNLPYLDLAKSMKMPTVVGLNKDEVEEFGQVLKTTLCAYIAFHAWMRPKECTIIGNMSDGYVFLPVKKKQKSSL